jgi:hypothetical protein
VPSKRLELLRLRVRQPPLRERDPIPWLLLRTRMEQTFGSMKRGSRFVKRCRSLAPLNDRHCR